ncbi:MAG: hypothetical protein Dasosvirus4_21 [Dasosvirus sp.]|uniref:Uncharacterized protein n=1 Tax=Dasosvirus sp. TaxID=2487764 RepID=A0A3G4ZRG8_9VIRU|nr:MAG: hypothetical protein Dasosvirus4_21 [Dasosvirus sp.]
MNIYTNIHIGYIKEHLQEFGDSTKFYLAWNDETKYIKKRSINRLTRLDNVLYINIVPTSYHKLLSRELNCKFLIYQRKTYIQQDDGREFVTWVPLI